MSERMEYLLRLRCLKLINYETTHLRGLLEFLDLVFLLQNSVEKNLNVSLIIDIAIGMSRPRLPHYWPNGDPDPVN